MRGLLGAWNIVGAAFLLQLPYGNAAEYGRTKIHEAGRCAIRGHCGKQSIFGSELPCADNGLAEKPDEDVRKKLVSICGEKWSDSDVCCREEQLDALKSNLNRAESIIGACPACQANFFNLFCTFTCSPDQSLFVNVSETVEKNDKLLVTELDNVWSNKYGKGFYDSCKDVKFGGTNGRAMDLIGGGAKNFTNFLKFLGQKRFAGSPFQMNFPRPNKAEFPEIVPAGGKAKACNDTNENFRCSCVDCAASCPTLPEVTDAEQCYVGRLPCLSFAVIVIYAVFLLLLITAITGHVAYQQHTQSKNERLRLLQDTSPSDDEDEGDIVHNAGLLEKPQKQYTVNSWCDKAFSKLGSTCARYPAMMIGISFTIVVLLSLGWINFEVETDPVRLWVAPDSDAAQEKAFFDDNFGPFFRAEQAFLVNDTNSGGAGPVLSYDTLRWWFEVESRVERLMSLESGVTFDDICFKPTGDACVVQSVSGYFDNQPFDESDWNETLKDCVNDPTSCRPNFEQPIKPNLVLGGWNETALDAQALVVTWVANNHAKGTPELERAIDWEESLLSLMQEVQTEARERGLRVSFNTEISLNKELNKSANTDAKIVVVSYIIMFIYASLALGSTTLAAGAILRNPSNALVQSKFMLGVVGILIVLMSVSASVGLFSAAGIKVTLIIAEVIPFLVLAVGVDNIFLIVHEFERVNATQPDIPLPDRMAKALGRMGPSILLSASTETVAFALGTAVGMPAVRNFAAYAAGAVVINALLQITMFISVLALNQRRVEESRMDCIPCIRVKHADLSGMNGGVTYGVDEEGSLQRFIRKTYAPALLGKKAKVLVVTIFLALFAAGVALVPEVQLGLDRKVAIPTGSYMIDYFNDLSAYLDSGPPVYFVTREVNATQREHQQQLCSRFSTCDQFSVANTLEQERKRPNVSYIADASANWLDDFFLWLKPSLPCCYEGSKECFADREPPWNITLYGMPEGVEFISYLQKWISAPTNEECPLAGRAAYGNALVIDSTALTIPASHFRTAHTPLRSEEDCINAYAAARRIANDLADRTGLSIFPYSPFYIFFDQYGSIRQLAGALLGAALAAIGLLTTLLLGSLRTGLVVTLTVAMTLADILGAMAVARVSLNAVSLVNLIICVGIAVEFCAHLARAFAFPAPAILERARAASTGGGGAGGAGRGAGFRGRDARAWASLVNVGGSVFSGITITKLLGVCVLAFTRSKIFEVYYFRVWLALVIFAALHALVFLPVALSLFGGEGYVDADADGGLEQDLASRRYRALLPDDDYDSDEL
ncbi:MAG: hypothetical protein M1821_003849 [Bathelium mastoideum]|nr:MAG: hypothetical protein M1821_003849 [Bathelium mastoideum]KAI9690924.1 MAG: hypothetical protein M1822_008544 [Bathelium mastoideum]